MNIVTIKMSLFYKCLWYEQMLNNLYNRKQLTVNNAIVASNQKVPGYVKPT